MCRMKRYLFPRSIERLQPRINLQYTKSKLGGLFTMNLTEKTSIIREWDDGASKNHVKRTWCRVANHVARLVFGEGALLFTGRVCQGSNIPSVTV